MEFHSTALCHGPVSVPVPGMGDSITEGTIVEWVAEVGASVSEGDVIALIETDKVTIDIKADFSGVVVEHFGEVDDNVEVGKPLYAIDADATATASATTPSTPSVESPAVIADPLPPSPPPAPEESGHRVPSIKFLGKNGWRSVLSGAPTPAPVPDAVQQDTVIHMDRLDPMYGRPIFSEEEMEALISGGANVGPDVKLKSHGAIFAKGKWDSVRI